MAERSVVIRLLAKVDEYQRAMRDAEKATRGVGDETEKTEKRAQGALGGLAKHARENEQAWTDVGKVFMGVGIAAAAGVGAAVTTFATFDKQMSAVQAATLASADEMESLRGVAIKAGQDTAYSAREAAGGIEQLAKAGVSTADIIGGGLAGSLALAAAGELDVASAAEIAASTMVQFGLAGDQVGTVADALAAGANKAQGSVEDLGLALSYAGVPAAALGLSVEETTGVLGLFANAGIVGEKAGTALRSMLVSLQNPSEKAAGVMRDLGINAFDASGNFIGMEGIAGVLQERMGGLDQKTRGAALATIFGNEALGAATSLYNGGSSAVAQWTEAVSESGYAAEVASTRLDNLAGDVTILRGSLETALIGLGEAGSGPLRGVTQDLTTLVNEFSSLPEDVQAGSLAVGTVTAGIGLLGGAFFLATPKIVAANAALASMGPAGAKAAAGLSAAARGLVAFSGPLAVLTAGGLVAMDYWLDNKQAIEDYATSLDQATGAVTDFTRENAKRILIDNGTAAAARELGISMDTITEAATGNKAAIAEVDAVLAGHNAKVGEGTGLYGAWLEFAGKTTIGMNETAEAAKTVGRQVGIQNERLDESRDSLGLVTQATDEARAQMFGLAGQVETVGVVAAGLPGGIDPMSEAITESGEEAEAAAKKIKEWQDQLGSIASAFVEPLSSYKDLLAEKEGAEQASAQATADSTEDAEDSWEDYVGAVDVSLDEYAARLEEQNAAQEAWRDNLVTVTQRGGVEVGQILAGMGAEGAQITEDMAAATDEDFTRMANALIEDARFGGEGAVAELDTAMRVMAKVGKDGSKATVKGIADELGLGTDVVRNIAASYGIKLAEGINPLLSALGKDGVRPPRPGAGGELAYFANGGIEDHVAQIAGGGMTRVWAEPETMGEAYIPLAPTKRARSLDIWRETGRRLGVPMDGRADYADGGFYSSADVPRPPSTSPFRRPISTAGDAAMEKAYKETTDWLGGFGLAGMAGVGGGGTVASLIAFGRALMAQGFSVSENTALGDRPRPGAHSPTGYHYKFGGSGAIDVNAGAGESTAEKRRLAPIVAQALRLGFGAQFLSPGHYNHAHFDVGSYRRVGDLSRYMGGSRALADGGILNPHVRDKGGPLLPGFTYNGTGSAERVVGPGQRVFDGAGSMGARTTTVTMPVTVYASDVSTAERLAAATVTRMQDAIATNGLAGIAAGGV